MSAKFKALKSTAMR